MRHITAILTVLMLSACSGGSQPLDAQKFFESLEGPKVPTVNDALTESAKNAEKQGDFKGAIQYYQQVLEKQPDNIEAMLAMADAYRRSGDPDRAIALYDVLLLKDQKMTGAKEGKGLALMAKGDFDTPAALFEEAMKEDPTRWKTLNALGVLFTTRSMYTEANQYFEAALKQSPGNPSILNNLGLSQALARQFDPAIASLSQASALTNATSVDRKRVDLNLALVYAIAGKLDNANAIAQQYFTGPTLSNNMGLYAHLAKDDQMAKTYLNMALTESKTFYEKAWNNLQQIGTNTTSGVMAPVPQPQQLAPAAAAPVSVEKPAPVKTEKKEKPVTKKTTKKEKTKAVPKNDNDIADIVNSTGDKKTADPVPDSPIP